MRAVFAALLLVILLGGGRTPQGDDAAKLVNPKLPYVEPQPKSNPMPGFPVENVLSVADPMAHC